MNTSAQPELDSDGGRIPCMYGDTNEYAHDVCLCAHPIPTLDSSHLACLSPAKNLSVPDPTKVLICDASGWHAR
jgi:hypothetical protein